MREAAKHAVRKKADTDVAVVAGVDGVVAKCDVAKYDVEVDDADKVSLMVG